MISRLCVVVVMLAVGALLGVLVLRDAGYVLLSYGNYRIETSLWFGLFVVGVAFGVAYLLVKFVRALFHGTKTFRSWRQQNHQRTAARATHAALRDEFLGHEGRSRRGMRTAGSLVHDGVLHRLYGADLAHRAGDTSGRDELLHQIGIDNTELQDFVELRHATYNTADGQSGEVIGMLRQLHDRHPQSRTVMKELLLALSNLAEWHEITERTAAATALKALEIPELRAVLTKAWIARLLDSAEGDLAQLWSRLPKALQQATQIRRAYVDALRQAGDLATARDVLSEGLKQRWESEWVASYGTLHADVAAQLADCEAWLARHANDPQLLLAAGRLSLAANQLDSAREHLEACVRMRKRADVYVELSKLYLALGDAKRASDYLALATPSG